jgi:hypothetical protein
MDPSRELFTAVTERDYRRLSMLYAKNAKDSILSFLSLKSRWASSVSSGRSGKLYHARCLSEEFGGDNNVRVIIWALDGAPTMLILSPIEPLNKHIHAN